MVSAIPDLYRILGVPPTASEEDLDRAFRGLVRQLHPDTRPPSEPDADQRLQQILSAYTTLREPTRRAAYDRTRSATTPPPIRRIPPGSQPPSPPQNEPALRVGPVRWHRPDR